MSPITDYLPEEMTDGERAALLAATKDGWINPPQLIAYKPEPPRTWRSAHIRYLERRGMIGGRRQRVDNAFAYRLNAAGMRAREALR